MKKILLSIFIFAMFFGAFLFVGEQKAQAADTCRINNATWSPSDEQQDAWYVSGKSKASITISTKNCVGQTLILDIKEADSCPLVNCDDSLPDSKLENKRIKIEQVTTKIYFTAGEEACEYGPGYDCDYYFRIKDADSDDLLYSSWSQPKGELLYECTLPCKDNWTFDTLTYSGGLDITHSTTSTTNVDPTKTNPEFDPEYTLLAPIGNAEKIGNDMKIGDYLNIILLIAIGFCGALAVIMIVIRGIQYMGDESVFGKTEAKHKIMAAIGGLLLALGAYALLNTLNPKLVGGTVSFTPVEIELEEDGAPILSDAGKTIPGGGAGSCSVGFANVVTKGGTTFIACKSVAPNLKKMLDTAWDAGIKLSGGGFRDINEQIRLRKQNCAGDVYTRPSGQCRPPTARPGRSMHESGLAFDLKCDGVSITSKTNKCFVWLQTNAGSYGLKNLSSEPWHWSTTGH